MGRTQHIHNLPKKCQFIKAPFSLVVKQLHSVILDVANQVWNVEHLTQTKAWGIKISNEQKRMLSMVIYWNYFYLIEITETSIKYNLFLTCSIFKEIAETSVKYNLFLTFNIFKFYTSVPTDFFLPNIVPWLHTPKNSTFSLDKQIFWTHCCLHFCNNIQAWIMLWKTKTT